MKRIKNTIVLMMLLFMGSLGTFAQNQATVYEQLCQLNKYWQEHPMDLEVLEEAQTFESDCALIALHLELVEAHLRNNTPEGLTIAQKTNRTLGLDILKDYWQTGVFPINTRHGHTIPYFIDDFNTACAVGQIMREGTGAALAAQISAENNYAFIEDMTNPKIAQWANANGFTKMELRWIQPSYSPNVTLSHTNTAPNCNTSNGGIDITVVSSSMTIEGYEWREGVDLANPILQTTEDFTNSESGFYTLTITGTGGWGGGYNERFSLSDADGPAVFPTVTNQQCSTGEADGMIELGMGDAFSSIKWYDYQNNIIAEDVTQLTGLQGSYPGDVFMGEAPSYTHRVEVVDAGGCKTYREFYVEIANEGPFMSAWQTEVTPVDCGILGSIDLGTIYSENYEVYWNDGVTTEDRSNLDVGTYMVTITDDAGCDVSYSYLVENVCATAVDSSCLDLAGLDFGLCAAFLGIALVDGECIGISGCSTVADNGIDYGDFFFDDMTICTDVCTGSPPCDDTWLDDYLDNTEFSMTQYLYNGDTVYLQEHCDPFVADGLTTLFDCNGEPICYQGGFAGFNWEDCPSFPTTGVEVGPITACPSPDCDYVNPVTDLGFIDSMLTAFSILGSPDCGCYSSLSMVEYEGQVTFYLDSDCNFVDDPDLMYDCEGNIICTANGLTPPPYCGAFTIIDTLWTCSGGINPAFEDKITMELSLNILLEGAVDANGFMNPNLSENGLLTAHPYDGAPYNYTGAPLSGNIPEGAVDYILVQLKEDFGLPFLHEQVCFVLSDGSVVDEDGNLPSFLVNTDETLQIWMRHHNHLDVVSAFEITPAPLVPYFFTDAVTVMGTQQLKEIGPGLFAMFAGDINHDGTISVSDYDAWFLTPAVVNQYMSADANLDGVVQTTDYDKWFDNKAKIGFAQLMD